MPLNPDDFRRNDKPALVEAYLKAAFAGDVPGIFSKLLDLELAAKHLLSFKFGPVLPLGVSRPVRLTVSGVGEERDWPQRLMGLWAHSELPGFLDGASAASRKMVDWDGRNQPTIYLDDLQDVSHDFASTEGDTIMCATLNLGTGQRGIMTRHEAPPLERLTPEWSTKVETLVDAGATGLWGIRWEEREIAGVLVVTETRSWHDIQPMVSLARTLAEDSRLADCEKVLGEEGLMPYPDSIEILSDGSYDLTLAVIEKED